MEVIQDIWSPIPLEEKEYLHIQAYTLEGYAQKWEDEWNVSFWRNDENHQKKYYDSPQTIRVEIRKKIQKIEHWERNIANTDSFAQLVPVMPDRSIVIRPEKPLRVKQGGIAYFYVHIPIVLRLQAGRRGEYILAEKPIIELSHTWFGTPDEGLLCYGMDTKLFRDSENLENNPCYAIAPVYIKNSSSKLLNFSRLCLHVGYMSVYFAANRLWTSEAYVSFKGPDQESSITFSKKNPFTNSPGRKLSPPRDTPQRHLIEKSFDMFKILTGF